MEQANQGKVILLNGATSSGKTTIAKLLQAKIGEPFWHYSIDHLRDSRVVPMERFRSGEFKWSEFRNSFFSGFHQSLPVYAGAGNNLIVDHIIDTEEWMLELVQLLRPFDVFFVGVHCPVEELERREVTRGDRPLGDAKKDFETVHKHATYDLELDGTLAPEANVELLLRAWVGRTQPSAFMKMCENSSLRAAKY